MGNTIAPKTHARAKRVGQARRKKNEILEKYDASKTGSLNRDEVKAMAEGILTTYAPQLGGVTDEDVDLIMRLGGKNTKKEIMANEIPEAISLLEVIKEYNADLVSLFNKYDVDKSGDLPGDQLKNLLTELNDGEPVKEEDVVYVLNQVDQAFPSQRGNPIKKEDLKAAVACWYCLRGSEEGAEEAWGVSIARHISTFHSSLFAPHIFNEPYYLRYRH